MKNSTCEPSNELRRAYEQCVELTLANRQVSEGRVNVRLQDRLAHLRGTARGSAVAYDPEDILLGLSPQLVIDLARLAGATLEDLEVTLELMPWGDRATLAAYGIVVLGNERDKVQRGLTVRPEALNLISAAAEAVAAAASPQAVAKLLQQRGFEREDDVAPGNPDLGISSEDLNVVVEVKFVSPATQRRSTSPQVHGVVQGVRLSRGRRVFVVRVTGAAKFSNQRPAAPTRFVVSTSPDFEVRPDSSVVITYEEHGHGIVPQTIAHVGSRNST